jgi:hypothetical protein
MTRVTSSGCSRHQIRRNGRSTQNARTQCRSLPVAQLLLRLLGLVTVSEFEQKRYGLAHSASLFIAASRGLRDAEPVPELGLVQAHFLAKPAYCANSLTALLSHRVQPIKNPGPPCRRPNDRHCARDHSRRLAGTPFTPGEMPSSPVYWDPPHGVALASRGARLPAARELKSANCNNTSLPALLASGISRARAGFMISVNGV